MATRAEKDDHTQTCLSLVVVVVVVVVVVSVWVLSECMSTAPSNAASVTETN